MSTILSIESSGRAGFTSTDHEKDQTVVDYFRGQRKQRPRLFSWSAKAKAALPHQPMGNKMKNETRTKKLFGFSVVSAFLGVLFSGVSDFPDLLIV